MNETSVQERLEQRIRQLEKKLLEKELLVLQKTGAGQQTLGTHFHRLFDNAVFGMAICAVVRDEQGRIMDFEHLQVNQATEKHTGFQPGQLINKRASEIVSAEEVVRLLEIYGPVVETGNPDGYERYFEVYDRTLEVSAFHLEGDLFAITFIDITQHRQTEKGLKKIQNRHKSLWEAIGRSKIGILLMGPDHRVRMMNKPLVDVYGDQTGKICYQALGQAKAPCSYCKMNEVIQGNKRVHYQATIRGDRVYEIVAVPFTDTDGVVCKLEVFQDITDRKQAEEALDKSQKRSTFLSDVLERSSQACGVGFADGRIGIFNAAFSKLTGYSEQELQTMDWSLDLTPPEWRESEALKLAELEQTGQPVHYEKEALIIVSATLLSP